MLRVRSPAFSATRLFSELIGLRRSLLHVACLAGVRKLDLFGALRGQSRLNPLPAPRFASVCGTKARLSCGECWFDARCHTAVAGALSFDTTCAVRYLLTIFVCVLMFLRCPMRRRSFVSLLFLCATMVSAGGSLSAQTGADSATSQGQVLLEEKS